MSRVDTGRLFGLATKVLAQKALERAHGGWIPEKQRIKQEKEALRAHEKQKKEAEKRSKLQTGGIPDENQPINPAEEQNQPYDLGQQLQTGARFAAEIPASVNRLFVEPVTTGIQELMRPIQEGGGPESYQNPQMVEHAMNVVGGLGAGSMLTGPSATATNVLRSGMGPVAKEAVAQAPRQLSKLGFYSPAAERAAALQPSGDAAQMVAALKNTPGIKAEELMNAGLIDAQGNVHPDWAGRGKVSREDIVSHLQGQMPQVEETVLGGKQPFDAKRLEQLQGEYAGLKQHPIDDPSFGEEKYDEMIRLMNIRDQSSTDSLYRAAEEAMKKGQLAQRRGDNAAAERYFREHELLNVRAEKLDLQGQGLANPTKYSQYTLPGGENYREVLLKLPNQHESFVKDLRSQMSALDKTYDDAMQNYYRTAENNPAGHPDTLAAYDKVREIRDKQYELGTQLDAAYNKEIKSNFKSPHWQDPNVLAHIRMSDRTGPNGEKILHVEELQSDWGQKGKKEGFKDIAEKQYEEAREEEIAATQKIRNLYKELLPTGLTESQIFEHPQFAKALEEEAAAQNRRNSLEEQIKSGVSSAPYVTSTEGWTDLALKRVLKEAAEGGYDKVVWTPGAEQAARYDLSKHIDRLEYQPETKDLIGIKNGRVVFNQTAQPNEIENYVGKDVAKNLLSQPISGEDVAIGGIHTLSGQDLKVGGEGMKGYYDSIVPKRLQNLAKKHDKDARIGYSDLPLQNKKMSYQDILKNAGMTSEEWQALTPQERSKKLSEVGGGMSFPSLTITPAMRESILRGQSAYQRGGAVRKDFKQAHADARSQGLKTFTWTDPATGKEGTYTTALKRREGGRVYSLADHNQWKELS